MNTQQNRQPQVQDIFKVIAVSDNHNAFGLYQFIAVSRTGQAFKLHTGSLYKPTKGQDITLVFDVLKNEYLRFSHIAGIPDEIPEEISRAPKEVINEIFKQN